MQRFLRTDMHTDGTKKIKWLVFTLALASMGKKVTANTNDTITNILLWSPYYDAEVTNDYLSGCSELNCQLTYDRRLFEKSAAVVFYDRTLNISDLPAASSRAPNQHFVFFLMETPYYMSSEPFKALQKNFYTLTMTHRRDSDIYSPFGYFKKRLNKKRISTAELKRIIGGKKKMIGWMGSNCRAASKRHLYMNELSKYVKIDIYGKCGPYKCPKTELVYTEEDPCEQVFRNDYKFYLAFENSVCEDFVTEKIFNRINMFSVPLVFNRTIYDSLLPKGSFIAADDFENPKQLAEYLIRLANNTEQYIKYFQWMNDYETVTFPNGIHDGFCRLCQRLKDEKKKRGIEISGKAQDLKRWFVQNSQCHPTFVVDLLRKAGIAVK